jgi:hypothetical protein
MTSALAENVNTLIFCIVAKAVTVGLLILLLFDIGKSFSYMILTLILGMMVIIFLSLYGIYKKKKKEEKLKKEAVKAKPVLNNCPDYFVKSTNEESDIICKSVYPSIENELYRFTEVSTGPMVPDINLSRMISSSKTMQEMCEKNKYENISWTDLKARCQVLDTRKII